MLLPPLFPFSREVIVMKKEYLIQLPLAYHWVMTVPPLLTSALPLPLPPSFFHSELLLVFLGKERYDQAFDEELQSSLQLGGLEGASVEVSPGVTVSQQHLHKVIQGEELGDPSELFYRDPQYFLAGELYLKHYNKWCKIAAKNPSDLQLQDLKRIRVEVFIFA